MKNGKVFLGMLVSAGAGALLGLLFAPRKGQNTRNKLTKTSRKYANRLKAEFKDSLNDVTKKLKKAKAEVSDLAHQVKVKEERLKKESAM